MQLLIENNGDIRCVYGEEVDLSLIGELSISRGSHVEPTQHGCWIADLSPVEGPCLGPFSKRSDALDSEIDWLERHWLNAQLKT